MIYFKYYETFIVRSELSSIPASYRKMELYALQLLLEIELHPQYLDGKCLDMFFQGSSLLDSLFLELGNNIS